MKSSSHSEQTMGSGHFSIGAAAAASALLALFAPSAAGGTDKPHLDVEYFSTPQAAVDKMLEMAGVTEQDYLIDLGSGDGRIPITAAKHFCAKALGVDIDPERIAEANESTRKAGVEDKVVFKRQDLFDTDISEASVLTMFLLGSINLKLRPRLLSELKPGSRVVSYSFNMGDWKPDRIEVVDGRPIYLWIVPDG
jgi:tRNA G37 N-methylase Trm5